LYSVDESQGPPDVEEEDEHRYDRMHGVKPSSVGMNRKRPVMYDGDSEANDADSGSEDPSELYARLIASPSVTAGASSKSHRRDAMHSDRAKGAKKAEERGFVCEVCGIQVTSVNKEVSIVLCTQDRIVWDKVQ
jgi:hypothetical protein